MKTRPQPEIVDALDGLGSSAINTDTHFVQPKITGYRQLSAEEVALMNEGKALAEACGIYVEKLRTGTLPLDQRWISIGATDLQRGFMAVIRGIAQPTTF
jgi:hypothetical protein